MTAMLVALSPVALAVGVDAGSHEVGVQGQSAGADTRAIAPDTPAAPADADAALGVSTGDVTVGVDGPSCQLEGKAKVSDAHSACSAGGLRTNLPTASLTYDIDLRLGSATKSVEGEATPGIASTESAFTNPIASNPLAIVVVAAAGGMGLLYAIWRVAKFGLLGAFVPLATHIRDDELLDDANRRAIYDLIKAEPGIATKEMAERLDLAWGTVTHHLSKLERRRFVVSKKYGKYRRYFVNGGTVAPEQKDRVAILKVARTADVAEFIRTHPGMSQKEVGEALGVSSSTVLWHVKRLLEVQAINRVRDGKEVRYFPTATTQTTVIMPPAPEREPVAVAPFHA
ncbi:MAG TPA: winged helix-turn-helix transcriptional regulator [Candidatus Thermoplasmatota archaeon]|nr:winged helix-turn-helix transcriptional regulator [Candidatus Thermoplasmatota archaeon]